MNHWFIHRGYKQKRKNSLQLRLQSCFSIISSLVSWVFLICCPLRTGKTNQWAFNCACLLNMYPFCNPHSFFFFFGVWYFSSLSWDPSAYQLYFNLIIRVYCGCTCILLHTFLYSLVDFSVGSLTGRKEITDPCKPIKIGTLVWDTESSSYSSCQDPDSSLKLFSSEELAVRSWEGLASQPGDTMC